MIAMAIIGSFFYNRWHHVGVWLILWLVNMLIGIVISMTAHAATLAVVWHSPLQQTLKGAGSSRWMLVCVYMVRVLSLLMVFAVSSLAVNDAVTLVRAQQRYDLWSGATQLGKISLGGGTFSAEGDSDMTATLERVGTWEKELNEQGNLLVAVANPQSGMNNNKDLTVHGRPRDILYVNGPYLRLQKITDTNGTRIKAPATSTGVTIIIPQSSMDEASQIRQTVAKDMESRGKSSDTIPNATPVLSVIPTPDGHERFTYTAADISTIPGGYQPEPAIHDPVLVVLPADTPFLPAGDYYGYTTWGSILTLNTRRAIRSAKAQLRLTRDVLGISPAVQSAAENLATAHLTLATSILNVALGLSATLVTTIGLAVVYTRRRAQFIFAARISGWTYRTMFAKLFVFDSLLTLIIVAGTSAGLNTILASMTTSGIAQSTAIATLHFIIPVAGSFVALAAIGALIGSVVWCSNTIVRARSADVA
jgi:hypothetical protein